MPRYYFDSRDNEKFVRDDGGVEFASFEQVKFAASQAMADFAKDVLPGSIVRTLGIEVRDDVGPVHGSNFALRSNTSHWDKSSVRGPFGFGVWQERLSNVEVVRLVFGAIPGSVQVRTIHPGRPIVGRAFGDGPILLMGPR